MALSARRDLCAPHKRNTRVLVVDDAARQWQAFEPALTACGTIDIAESTRTPNERLGSNAYAVAVCFNGACPDGKHSVRDDLVAAKAIRDSDPSCPILFVVRRSVDMATCCQAIRLGVVGFVEADGADACDQLNDRLAEVLARRAKMQVTEPAAPSTDWQKTTGIVTQSETMLRVLTQARRAAHVCDAPVIIEGESGTGKQLFAEAVHKLDPKRSVKAFVAVNCAAISGTLAESALFGHRKGAFTGATEDRLGHFRSADGGTLMLDEISELELALQPKLLRVLQEGRVMPVGDDREYAVNVRVVAASNKPLAEEVSKGKFRLDLYQRLNVIRLNLPPLRQRLEDIPLLVTRFVEKYAHYTSEKITRIDPAVHAVLGEAIGAGNVRELENVIRQTLAFKAGGSTLTVADLPEHVLEVGLSHVANVQTVMDANDLSESIRASLKQGPVDLGRMLEDVEVRVLKIAANEMGLKGGRLAEYLSLNRRTLYHKLQRHGLSD